MHKNGTLTRFKGEPSKGPPPGRGTVVGLSAKSRKRLTWAYGQGDWKGMITLTYHRGVPDFKESKLHLNAFLMALRRAGLKYLWVVEWQLRGSPHYHVWVDRHLDRQEYLRFMVTWLYETRNYNGSKEAREFHTHPKIYTDWNVRIDLNYATKYAQKLEQKYLPAGVERFGRWWGSSRNLSIPALTIEFDRENGFNGFTVSIGNEAVFHKMLCESFESNETANSIERHLTQHRRNIKRAVFAWSKRNKRHSFDRRTNGGCQYLFIPERMRCMRVLVLDALQKIQDDTGDMVFDAVVPYLRELPDTSGPPAGTGRETVYVTYDPNDSIDAIETLDSMCRTADEVSIQPVGVGCGE